MLDLCEDGGLTGIHVLGAPEGQETSPGGIARQEERLGTGLKHPGPGRAFFTAPPKAIEPVDSTRDISVTAPRATWPERASVTSCSLVVPQDRAADAMAGMRRAQDHVDHHLEEDDELGARWPGTLS